MKRRINSSEDGCRVRGVHVPMRRCVGCRTVRPKHELVRYAKEGQRLVIDLAHRLPGRGAYTCPEADCLRAGIINKGFRRTLRFSDLIIEEEALTRALLENGASRSSGEDV